MTAVRVAPAIKARRALVYLDGTPSAPRLAAALRATGFDVRTVESADAKPAELAAFLAAALPGELLLVRWPSGAAWAPSAFTRLIVDFGARLGDSPAAALLLVVDFGWVLNGDGEARLNVPGDPPIAAAALTASLDSTARRPGGAPDLTGVLAEALLAADGPVTVRDLHELAARKYAGSGLTAMLFSHGDIGGVAVGTGRRITADPARRRQDAQRRAVRPRTLLASDRWTLDDRLGHRVYAEAIAAFLRHRDTSPPLTIGIKGPWGAGKTSLMRMVRHLLDPPGSGELRLRRRTARPTNADVLGRLRGRPQEDACADTPADAGWRPTVWFNPWMYQSGEQVWAGLAHEIITQITGRLPAAERERFWLELNLSRIDTEAVRRRLYWLALTRLAPVALGLLATALVTAACAAASALVPALGGTAAAVASAGCLASVGAGVMRMARFLAESADGAFGSLVRQPDPLMAHFGMPDQGYRDQAGLLHLVQGDMRRVLDLVASEEHPLVVFVDDLDRCSPGTVAQVIEAINLFVAGEFGNCVFVLGMEPEVVAAHVGLAYRELVGALPDECAARLGWRFLEKIVQLPLSVPSLDDGVPEYVREVLGVGTPARRERSEAPPEPRAELVDRLENAIRDLSPTIETLDQAARSAQAGLGADAWEAAARAADRIFDELYSDERACRALETALPALNLTNPREVKRYLNVFRFYSFITYRRHLAGEPHHGDACVAKVAALTVRWPHLLWALAREAHPGATVLERLEETAQACDGDGWARAMAEAGLAEEEALRQLLATRPPIGALARTLL
ncbi:KAP family P-loop NTPase fold protein [Nonomuraea typhae]|uniref:KAP family P-loop NTPase fold protein n=1 Tax=Nonomuraea typhae TaxID=2603600 RepID=UPI0012F8FC1C|nr:P-loop NTPase fold protein [Nonomuraea typhae]